MSKDKLIECARCKGNACYEQHLEGGITTWLCWGCGFTTSTLMTEGSKAVKTALETSPELYKDIMFVDKKGLHWLPATISIPNQGIVFVDGTNKKDWRWAAAKAIPLQEGDKKLAENQTHKMDMKNAKYFEQNNFMDAAEYINMFSVGE